MRYDHKFYLCQFQPIALCLASSYMPWVITATMCTPLWDLSFQRRLVSHFLWHWPMSLSYASGYVIFVYRVSMHIHVGITRVSIHTGVPSSLPLYL